MKINEKLVLVTGASSGMGEGIAKAMAKAGGKLILLARNQKELERVANEIKVMGGEAHVFSVDLKDAEAVANVAAQIKQQLGIPDILVNNAGAGKWRFVDETTPAEAVEMMALPYFAAFNVTHAFYADMVKRNSGHIVNVSSVASRFVWPGATTYTAARWAVRGFTQALRADLHSTNIGVTLYESGTVKSPYWDNNPGSHEREPKIAMLIPQLTSEEVGKAVVCGVERNKKLVIVPFMMKAIYWQHVFFPWLVQWLLIKTGYSRK
ncbi:MAG: SDR family NAD(P)-dependent oxidoreductase [Methylophilaceae bacterium]